MAVFGISIRRLDVLTRGCRVQTWLIGGHQAYRAVELRNVERDAEHLRKLRKAGWKALVIWECETSDPERLERRLSKFLGPAKKAT